MTPDVIQISYTKNNCAGASPKKRHEHFQRGKLISEAYWESMLACEEEVKNDVDAAVAEANVLQPGKHFVQFRDSTCTREKNTVFVVRLLQY